MAPNSLASPLSLPPPSLIQFLTLDLSSLEPLDSVYASAINAMYLQYLKEWNCAKETVKKYLVVFLAVCDHRGA